MLISFTHQQSHPSARKRSSIKKTKKTKQTKDRNRKFTEKKMSTKHWKGYWIPWLKKCKLQDVLLAWNAKIRKMNNAVVLSPGKTGIFSLLAKACVLRSFRTVWQECLWGGSLEPAAWVQVPDLPFISCVALINRSLRASVSSSAKWR